MVFSTTRSSTSSLGLVDVEQNGIDILGLVENLHVMGETDAQKIVPIDFGRRRLDCLDSSAQKRNFASSKSIT